MGWPGRRHKKRVPAGPRDRSGNRGILSRGATLRRKPPPFAVVGVPVGNSRCSDLSRGQVMELSNYELVRYPSGQLTLTRVTTNAQGKPSSGPRDVVGVFTSEAEAQRALERLLGNRQQSPAL